MKIDGRDPGLGVKFTENRRSKRVREVGCVIWLY